MVVTNRRMLIQPLIVKKAVLPDSNPSDAPDYARRRAKNRPQPIPENSERPIPLSGKGGRKSYARFSPSPRPPSIYSTNLHLAAPPLRDVRAWIFSKFPCHWPSQMGFNRPPNIVIDTNALFMKQLSHPPRRDIGRKGYKTRIGEAILQLLP